MWKIVAMVVLLTTNQAQARCYSYGSSNLTAYLDELNEYFTCLHNEQADVINQQAKQIFDLEMQLQRMEMDVTDRQTEIEDLRGDLMDAHTRHFELKVELKELKETLAAQ